MQAFTVHNLLPLNDNLFELQLERGDASFLPGACMALFNDSSDSRPYSIAAGTGEKLLRFIIRRVPGGRVSDWLARRRPGEVVQASEPFGWFRPGRSAAGERCVFIATGTGIAPFLSHLRSAPALPPVACLYGVRWRAEAFAIEELMNLPGFRLAVSKTRGTGHYHGRVSGLFDQLPLAGDIHYYLCGLDTMIDEASDWLEAHGIYFTQIHREIFFYEDGSH